MEEENKYFQTHPVYKTMDKEYLGTRALVSKLTTVFFSHIKRCLPEIIKEI